jgi:glycosyltransferase involved in cell wall biosynthesis
VTVKVGVNLLWLVPGDVGGSEQSTLASLRALGELAPPDLDLRLFVLEPFAAAYPDVVAAFPTEVMALSGRSRVVRVLGEATWLARRTSGLDLVHNAGGTAPARSATPYVLTIHDLQPLERRETHSPSKRAYLRAVLPRAIRGAQAVAVPSDFVRRSVLERFAADPDRVVTIPHGVAHRAASAIPEREVRARFGLPGPVVLYPAISYPHKDHATLIEAFSRVHAAHPDAVLVLTGGEGACEPDVRRQIARLGLEDHVRRTGRVSDADVAGLYEVATVVAVPSVYEGFGLPAAEAMAAGVALVAADATALPEVVGDAGLLVAPGDVPAWADAVSRLLADPGERTRLVGLGRERVQRYTWAANAGAFADLYRRSAAHR